MTKAHETSGRAAADGASSLDRLRRSIRWIAPIAFLAPWLAVVGSWQIALFPRTDFVSSAPPSELVAVAIAASIVVRNLAPSLATHLVALAVTTGGIALLAAQIGRPLANATADYCGDVCRTEIVGRFATYFGWPIATATVLVLVARRDRDRELAAWTRPWAIVTLVIGLAAALSWWRTILPNG